MRDATGGSASSLGALVALPILWLALHGPPWSIGAAAFGTAVVFLLPIVVLGAPDYPAAGWRESAIWVAVACLVGPGIQGVVRQLRESERDLSAATTDLQASRAQWELFGEELPETVVMVVDDDLRYQQVSGAGRIRPLVQEWEGKTLAEVATPDNLDILEPIYRAALEGEAGSVELLSSADGTPHQVDVVPFSLHGEPAALVVARDVGAAQQREAEARRSADQLRHLAEHDQLTGLVNRGAFDELVRLRLEECAATGEPAGALFVLDVDHFKKVNDTFGHHVGDRLIVAVADLIKTAVRDTDVVARRGGDEFAVLLPDADPAVAEQVAQRIVVAMRRQTAGVPEITGPITISLGIVAITDPHATVEALLVAADGAMYDAKRAGGNRFVVAPSGG